MILIFSPISRHRPGYKMNVTDANITCLETGVWDSPTFACEKDNFPSSKFHLQHTAPCIYLTASFIILDMYDCLWFIIVIINCLPLFLLLVIFILQRPYANIQLKSSAAVLCHPLLLRLCPQFSIFLATCVVFPLSCIVLTIKVSVLETVPGENKWVREPDSVMPFSAPLNTLLVNVFLSLSWPNHVILFPFFLDLFKGGSIV